MFLPTDLHSSIFEFLCPLKDGENVLQLIPHPKFGRDRKRWIISKQITTFVNEGYTKTRVTVNGIVHCENGPAEIFENGKKEWYKNGLLHRDDDLPAIEWENGTKYWYENGLLHRDNDLPAFEWSNGTKFWFKNGQPHRDNDLPAMVYQSGEKFWYKNGKLYL